MTVDVLPALVAGTLAGLSMTMMRAALAWAGVRLRLDVLGLWAEMFAFGQEPARLIGLAIHLAGSAVIGLAYAVGLAVLSVRHVDLGWGLVGGAIHWLVAGLFMATTPPTTPAAKAGPNRSGIRLLPSGCSKCKRSGPLNGIPTGTCRL